MGHRSVEHAEPDGPHLLRADPDWIPRVCSTAHARRVAALSALIAAELGEGAETVRDVYLAGNVHEIDSGDAVRADYERLGPAATYVARMGEPFESCATDDEDVALPRGARILAVADAFDTETCGDPTAHRQLLALARIVADAGSRYDPAIVRALLSVLDSSGHVCH